MNDDFQLNNVNPNLNPYMTSSATSHTQSASPCLKSLSSSNNAHNQQQPPPQQQQQSSSLLYYSLLNPKFNQNSTTPNKIIGMPPNSANSNSTTISNIELNMLDIILNEIELCVESKETSERLKQMISQMHLYFSEKLNELFIGKNKILNDFEEVRSFFMIFC